MKAIVAADRKWGIGRDGGLLVHLPGDMRYFRKMTMGKVIIVGRKTLESFPGGRPLPGRTTVVLTSRRDYECRGCTVCCSKGEVMEFTERFDSDDVFVSGGEEIYRLFIDECDGLYITEIDGDLDADRHFPDPAAAGFVRTETSGTMRESGYDYRFAVYSRKR